MSGDATLFARRDEVEQAWAFIDTVEEAWAAKEDAPKLVRLIRPARGDRRKPTSCWRATDATLEEIVKPMFAKMARRPCRNFCRRIAGRDRPDRSRTEEALGCRRTAR